MIYFYSNNFFFIKNLDFDLPNGNIFVKNIVKKIHGIHCLIILILYKKIKQIFST